MHHSVLCVGHQSDEVLVGCNAKGERQQFVLQGVRAQCTLQVIWWAVLQAKPCGWIPLVVWWTRCVNTLVTSSHVKAHLVCSTLDVLFQALVYILTCFAIGREAVTSRTETPMASWCVQTLMLTGIPQLTLINVETGPSHSLRPVATWAGAMVAASCILTDLIVSALMSAISALINVYTCPIATFSHAIGAQVNTGVTTSCVFTLLI